MKKFLKMGLLYKDPDESSDDWGEDSDGGGYDNETSIDQGNDVQDSPSGYGTCED